jgi:Holliday junction resolvase RusA-like endonuclease
MYERTKSYIIELPPQPWKRPGLNGRRFFDQQEQDKLAFGLYLTKQHANEPPFSDPISFNMTFFFAFPKSFSKTQRTYWAPNKCDIDNLAKFIFDTCVEAGIITDDHIICALLTKKVYAAKPRVELVITELQ